MSVCCKFKKIGICSKADTFLNYCFNNKQKWDYTIFFPWFNWSYLQTVWSAVNLKYNPYLLYIAFWFANCLQEYENYCCKIKTLEKQGKDHSYQETNWREQVLQPTNHGPIVLCAPLIQTTAHVCHVVTDGSVTSELNHIWESSEAEYASVCVIRLDLKILLHTDCVTLRNRCRKDEHLHVTEFR